MSTLPTQRTLKWLRDRGMCAQVVERWNAYAKIRVDLFGVIDIVTCHGLEGISGVQACAGASVAARVDKALAEPRLKVWLAAGGKFFVIGWRQVGPAGKRKLWKPRVVEIRLHDGELTTTEQEPGATP